LLAFIEELPSAELVGELSLESAADQPVPSTAAADWPTYSNLLVRYRGQEASLSEQAGLLFELLWEARGELVTRRELENLFPSGQNRRQQVHTVIYRMRTMLGETIPSVRVEKAGNGYYLAVTPQ
jgi:DNA-binding response OmpR family regulator